VGQVGQVTSTPAFMTQRPHDPDNCAIFHKKLNEYVTYTSMKQIGEPSRNIGFIV
jgi:hypothetical protein